MECSPCAEMWNVFRKSLCAWGKVRGERREWISEKWTWDTYLKEKLTCSENELNSYWEWNNHKHKYVQDSKLCDHILCHTSLLHVFKYEAAALSFTAVTVPEMSLPLNTAHITSNDAQCNGKCGLILNYTVTVDLTKASSPIFHSEQTWSLYAYRKTFLSSLITSSLYWSFYFSLFLVECRQRSGSSTRKSLMLQTSW